MVVLRHTASRADPSGLKHATV